MKNNRLAHRGHFPLLREGGWTGSQVLARNSRGSHCDWLVGMQQIPVLTLLVLPCPRCTLWGGQHACRVLLHPPSTDPHSEKGCPKSGEAGLPQPPGHAVLEVRLGTKVDGPGTKGARVAQRLLLSSFQ